MNIQAEKLAIIKRLGQVQDISLIKAISNLLDFGLKNQEADFWDELKEGDKRAIDEGLSQLDRGECVSHDEIRKKIERKFDF